MIAYSSRRDLLADISLLLERRSCETMRAEDSSANAHVAPPMTPSGVQAHADLE
jgi:hypothetical protein